jgi:hypothetical protein
MVCVSILTTQSRCQQRLVERLRFREARHPKRLKAAVKCQEWRSGNNQDVGETQEEGLAKK